MEPDIQYVLENTQLIPQDNNTLDNTQATSQQYSKRQYIRKDIDTEQQNTHNDTQDTQDHTQVKHEFTSASLHMSAPTHTHNTHMPISVQAAGLRESMKVGHTQPHQPPHTQTTKYTGLASYRTRKTVRSKTATFVWKDANKPVEDGYVVSPDGAVKKKVIDRVRYDPFVKRLTPGCRCGKREWIARIVSGTVLIALWIAFFLMLFVPSVYRGIDPPGLLSYKSTAACICCDPTPNNFTCSVEVQSAAFILGYPTLPRDQTWGDFCASIPAQTVNNVSQKAIQHIPTEDDDLTLEELHNKYKITHPLQGLYYVPGGRIHFPGED